MSAGDWKVKLALAVLVVAGARGVLAGGWGVNMIVVASTQGVLGAAG